MRRNTLETEQEQTNMRRNNSITPKDIMISYSRTVNSQQRLVLSRNVHRHPPAARGRRSHPRRRRHHAALVDHNYNRNYRFQCGVYLVHLRRLAHVSRQYPYTAAATVTVAV